MCCVYKEFYNICYLLRVLICLCMNLRHISLDNIKMSQDVHKGSIVYHLEWYINYLSTIVTLSSICFDFKMLKKASYFFS